MSEFGVKLQEAKQRLPLRRLMEQHGKAPDGKKCPYCGKKSEGLFKSSDGVELFKCWHATCPTGTNVKGRTWDEIGFLAYELKLSRADAAVAYLKEAGVWEERDRYAPAGMSGKAGRKRLIPNANATEEEEGLGSAANSCSQPDTATASRSTQESRSPGDAEAVPSASSSSAESATVPPAGPPDLTAGGASISSEEKLTTDGRDGTDKKEGKEPSGGGGWESGPPEEGDAGPLLALRWFYEQLTLTEQDARALWLKRGLTPDTVAAMGYRSNLRSNREILLGMEEMFSQADLVESGLWSKNDDKPGEPPKPNAQFYGYGIVGKVRAPKAVGANKERERGESKIEWGWTLPVLIPYFDEDGELVALRPHKGMMRDKAPRLYVARPGKDMETAEQNGHSGRPVAVVTEGEFKAAALWQGLRDSEMAVAVASLPGITMAKPLFGDIEQWVLDSEAGPVVMAYDNEEKGDEKLPGYQEDKRDRYDSEVWARYLCGRIAKEGWSEAKVAHLPNEWRDARTGKADWDSALARLIREYASPPPRRETPNTKSQTPEKPQAPNPKSEPDGSNWREEAAKVWLKVAGRVRGEFLKVLKGGVRLQDSWNQPDLFEGEEQRIIRNKLERISYEPKLPIGDDHELAMARRLHGLASRLRVNGGMKRLPGKGQGFLHLLAKKYQETRGRYYVLKPLTEKVHELWAGYFKEASEKDDVEVRRACEVALAGVPNWVSDFRMRAHYVLNRLDGTRERIVTLRNVHGVESRVVALTSQAFAQPVRFREWLLNIISGATWNAGQQELNFLQADVAHEVAWKDVGEVAVRGYDENSKLWFFRTEPGGLAMAYLPDGTEKFASKEGVIWHEGQGYRMSETDHEGQDFCQGEPCLWPAVKATEEELRTLFQEVSQRLYDTIGGYAGYLALGAMLAFGAGPELYARYTAFPGLWLHGETNQGKSSVSKWLLRLWGFKKEEGVSLPDSTKVGVSIAVQQYGNLPVWLEEYQPKCPPWMQEKIKGIYNRESGIKKVFEEKGTRKIRTNVIITGVATSPDSQLRSRYCHVPVSERNRIKEHYQWFEDESPRFYLLGRHILRNRKEFARLTLDQMKGWIDKRGGTIKDARARIVHGASYAAFAAMAALLQSHGADLLNGFAEFLQQHCVEAVSEVKEQVNVNQFWTDLLAALTSNAFGETPADRRHMFIAIKKKGDQPPAGLTEHQREVGEKNPKYCWMGYRLYFRSDPVIDALRRYKRLMGRELPLDRADLRSQMKSRPYWVAPKRDVHKQRFQGAKTTLSCWCVDLDLFEGGLGFNPVTDEEFQASLCRDGNIEEGEFLSMEEWEDPRAGDLYSLVDLLKSQEEKS